MAPRFASEKGELALKASKAGTPAQRNQPAAGEEVNFHSPYAPGLMEAGGDQSGA